MKEYKVYFDNTYEIIDSEQKAPSKAPASSPAKSAAGEKKNELFVDEETGLRLNRFPAKPSLVATVVAPNYDPKSIFADDPKEPAPPGGKASSECRRLQRISPAPYTFEDSYKDTFGSDSK